MQTLNFNFPFKNLDGSVALENGKEISASTTLANLLSQATNVDSLKFMSWAQELIKGTELSLDPSDSDTLKNFIKNHQGLIVLSKAQLLEVFSKTV